jgi:cathepsin F
MNPRKSMIIVSIFYFLIFAFAQDNLNVTDNNATNADGNGTNATIPDGTNDQPDQQLINGDIIDNYNITMIDNNSTDQQSDDNDIEMIIFSSFKNFIKTYNKTYSSLDDLKQRYDIFKQNYISIIIGNNNTNITFVYGITQFFDMTPSEFQSTFLSAKTIDPDDIANAQTPSNNSLINSLDNDSMPEIVLRSLINEEVQEGEEGHLRKLQTLPKSFDWRNYGAVTSVKNQGSCGCCWAFSVAANLEGRYFLKHGVLYSLSPQQLLSCDVNNQLGCYGGDVAYAFSYLMRTTGLTSWNQFPYYGYQTYCYTSLTPIAQVSGYQFAGTTNENAIAQMLMTYGPLVVNMNGTTLQYYTGGIFYMSATYCSPYYLNHSVLLVGFGQDPTTGINYWTVKNQWGPYWGENGFFRIARGYSTCGINQYVVTGSVY